MLSPLSVVASSAESLLFTANSATTVAASAGSLYSPAGTYSLADTAGSRRLRLLHSTSQVNCSLWTNLLNFSATHCNYSAGILTLNSLCHQLYSRGRRLLLTVALHGVYHAAAARASAAQQPLRHPRNTSHSTVGWSPSNGCKQTPYCLQHERHSLLLRVRLATVLNKHSIDPQRARHHINAVPYHVAGLEKVVHDMNEVGCHWSGTTIEAKWSGRPISSEFGI
jgi:hypothetical protein